MPRQDSDHLNGNDIAPTAAEQEVLDAAKLAASEKTASEIEKEDRAGGATGATGATGAAADEGATGATGSAETEGATGATAAEGATGATGEAEPVTSSAPPQAFPTIAAPADRDFAAELKKVKTEYREALKQLDDDYDKSKLTDEEVATKRAQLDDQYEDSSDKIKEARTKAATRAELAKELGQQSWEVKVDAFLRLPESDILRQSKAHRTLWQASMQEVVDEAAAKKETLTEWQILELGRTRLYETIGIKPGVVAKTPDPKPKPDRAPKVNEVPPTIGRAPAATGGSKTTIEELSNLGIQDVEKFMATQSDSQRDELLRGVDGRFVD